MWLDTDVKKIDNPSSEILSSLLCLEELITANDWNKEQLARYGPLSGRPVLYQQRYYGKIQGMMTKNYDQNDNIIQQETYNVINHYMKLFPNYEILKSELSICPPGIEQGWHVDPRAFHRFSRRIHIPIVTNSNAYLDIEDARYHLETHSIYEFNNLKQHRSLNLGTSMRSHIIFDIIRKDWFESILEKNEMSVFYKIVTPTDKNNFHNPETVMLSWDRSTDFFNHAFE